VGYGGRDKKPIKKRSQRLKQLDAIERDPRAGIGDESDRHQSALITRISRSHSSTVISMQGIPRLEARLMKS
jgi:hypothetical protein